MMINKHETIYAKDGTKKLKVIREFDAPVEQVWQAWTDQTLLDQWWAPKPWTAKTKSMDFREGGKWIYAMVGPEGEEQWCRANFHSIEQQKGYTGTDMFCDIEGNPTTEMPVMHWDVKFNPIDTGTRVDVVLTFNTEADLQKIVEMGFEEGFRAAHTNLDALLASIPA